MSVFKSKEFKSSIIAIICFLVLSVAFNLPVFQGERLSQGDMKQFHGSASETKEYRENFGRQILWTNVMFSGMPAYMINASYYGELMKTPSLIVESLLKRPSHYFFLMMLSFYILLRCLKIDYRVAIIGSIAYAFSSYFVVALAAGHNSKIHALCYLPGILAGAIWVFREKKLWLGASVFTLFMAMEIKARHPQMLYYFLFVLLAYGILELIQYIKRSEVLTFIKFTAVLIVGILLAALSSYPFLKNTMDYGKHSTRGKSELTIKEDVQTDGLDRDYVTFYSYGVSETMSFLIPNFKGGQSMPLGQEEKYLENVDPSFRQAIAQQSQYFGDQPGSSGAIYVGALILLLAVFSLITLKDPIKYPLLIASVITIMLAWGKNFQAFSDFFIDYVPYYDKFRAVVSIMIVPEFCIPLLAALGLNRILKKEFWKATTQLPLLNKSYPNSIIFYWVSGVFIVFCVILYLAPGAFNSFLSQRENSTIYGMLKEAGLNSQQSDSFVGSLISARQEVFKADVLRTLFFLIAGFGLVFLYMRNSLNKVALLIGTGLLVTIDMFVLDKRYMNDENFESKRKFGNNYGIQKSQADQMILQDQDPNYRVLNLTVSPFNDATTSYYHKSIGGYHGAKLEIYQELIEYQLSNDIEMLSTKFNGGATSPNEIFADLNSLNMLNTKYVIINQNGAPVKNPRAAGNAWFVDDLEVVKSADKSITSLDKINIENTAIIRDKFIGSTTGDFDPGKGTGASIKLSSYDPEKLVYSSVNNQDGFGVFSEIYYPDHWKAYIDGEETEILRVNYVLRGLKIPAGTHEIVFEFKDRNWVLDNTIAMISSIIVLLGVPVSLFFRNRKNGEINE